MIRKKKKFSWPRKLYDKSRILEENKLKEKYGLKNKREIWKTETKVKYFRNRAKSLITADAEKLSKFFRNLNKYGFNVKTTADVLALNVEDILKRRLSSILVQKKIATAPKQARQMITHKKIMIGDSVVNVPGYLVRVDEENLIKVKEKVKKPKHVIKKEEKSVDDVEKNTEMEEEKSAKPNEEKTEEEQKGELIHEKVEEEKINA
jgi:small subunit ribosomal protein S4